MKKFFSLVIAFSLCTALATAQSHEHVEKCGTHIFTEREMAADPQYKADIEAYRAEIQRYIEQARREGKPKNGGKRIIPVVFHVIHEYGSENISKEQILSQIESLNRDFSFTNPDKSNIPAGFMELAADPEIEFRLATKDDAGRCTDGIVRIYSPKTSNAADVTEFKALSFWNSYKYLNIWVVRSIASSVSSVPGQVLGYAQFPGTRRVSTDGIVLRSDCVGTIGTAAANNRRGRTATHEIGHWLGLRHIWGDADCGSDGVDDTPIAFGPNYGICWNRFPYNTTSCDRPQPDTLGEMFMNYMDYSDDHCMAMFTKGQKEVMDATLNGYRKHICSPENLEATGTRDEDINTPLTCAPVADFSENRKMICAGTTVTFRSTAYRGTDIDVEWEFEGGNPSTSTANPVTVTYSNSGSYNVKMRASNQYGSTVDNRDDYILVSSGTADYSGDTFYEDFESPAGEGWMVINPDKTKNRWEHVFGAGFESHKAFRMRAFESIPGEYDDLISPAYDFSSINLPSMSFMVASAERGSQAGINPDDRLVVSTSSNCGQTWSQRKAWSGNDLISAGLYTNEFVPSSTNQWKMFSVGLSGVTGQSNVRIRFRFETGSVGINNLYIDNIHIGRSVGIEKPEDQINLSVYPNPSTSVSHVSFYLNAPSDAVLEVFDMAGKKVLSPYSGRLSAGDGSIEMNLSGLTNGMYMVRFTVNGTVIHKKITKA